MTADEAVCHWASTNTALRPSRPHDGLPPTSRLGRRPHEQRAIEVVTTNGESAGPQTVVVEAVWKHQTAANRSRMCRREASKAVLTRFWHIPVCGHQLGSVFASEVVARLRRLLAKCRRGREDVMSQEGCPPGSAPSIAGRSASKADEAFRGHHGGGVAPLGGPAVAYVPLGQAQLGGPPHHVLRRSWVCRSVRPVAVGPQPKRPSPLPSQPPTAHPRGTCSSRGVVVRPRGMGGGSPTQSTLLLDSHR